MTTSPTPHRGRGPVAPTEAAIRVHDPLTHDAVHLVDGGWLRTWQVTNSSATLAHVLDHVESGEARSNLARVINADSEPFRGMFFTDTDVYKLLEALAWASDRDDLDPALLERGAKLVDLLQKTQEDDGYLNSFVQGNPDVARWSDPQWGHELYSAGHLFQAAVAAARMNVFEELPVIAERLAHLLVTTHGAAGNPYIDGHPQVETALVELYRQTGDTAFLDLATEQIDRRGHRWLGEDRFGSPYFQDHEPVRTATTATGHAVRQLYLLTGAVDVAVERHDLELLRAVERIWDDLFGTKTYISGAHGSRHRDEAIGDPYELPPDRAYAETCAAIASFHLNWRLLLATGNSRYADEMEKVLYNAVAVSTSVDGTSFFYSNPLQLRGGHDGSHEDAPSQRLSWFTCACCPPNVARLLASVHDYLATATTGGLAVHHYTSCRLTLPGRPDAALQIDTAYPYRGSVAITVDADGEFELALRIPGWATQWSLAVEGEPVEAKRDSDGYARLSRSWRRGEVVELELAMPVRTVTPHHRVDAVRGTVAVLRGPVLYAVEQADLPTQIALEDIELIAVGTAVSSTHPELAPVAIQLEVGVRADASAQLYEAGRRGESRSDRQRFAETAIVRALPYHRWANREPGPMKVWLPTAASFTPP